MVSGASIVIEQSPVKSAQDMDEHEANVPPLLYRLATAAFYGISSILIILSNKSVLTVYDFPSSQVLGVGQMVFAIILLGSLGGVGKIFIPAPNYATMRKIWPLPLLYCGNLFSGLGGTKELSLPMMTVLRRFSILMILIGEIWLLNAAFSNLIYISVGIMIGGAIIAAVNDLAFSLIGYSYIFVNDFFTAANGVVTKKKLDVKDLGKYGIIFYNCVFMIVPAVLIAHLSGELDKAMLFTRWHETWFQINFVCSCGMGFVLMYSIVLCTQYNSALTTSVIGCLKNVFISYFGMIFGGDYVFSWPNFWGLTISVAGSIVYAYATFKKPTTKKAADSVSKA
ncbi:nucleotide sugar transporter SLC35D1-like [Convolutriloba macropyga]|uniref:nucleotide sugar transporter SLC35D1-like n=1 Tax=Convolutriloba macropyga TaxID=536237 RepID=UPI003F51B622